MGLVHIFCVYSVEAIKALAIPFREALRMLHLKLSLDIVKTDADCHILREQFF